MHEALRAAEFDPRELEQTEERLFALRAAARKYDVPADGLVVCVSASWKTCVDRCRRGEARSTGEGNGGRRQSLRDGRAKALCRPPAKLPRRSTGQCRASSRRSSWSGRSLSPKSKRMKPTVTLAASIGSSSGHRPIPGTRPGPLMKVASGGELSRFMLALKVVLADKGSAPTLVFDEIDTGVGGAVADAIGHRLARLARRSRSWPSRTRRRSRRALSAIS